MEEKNDKVREPAAMTYGMSDYLVNSGLLSQISNLSTKDKQYLMGYIAQEVAEETEEDDVDWNLIDKDLPPYTLDELYARIDESHQQYLRGEYITAEESDARLKEEFLWLQ
jgi:hypothetical protein